MEKLTTALDYISTFSNYDTRMKHKLIFATNFVKVHLKGNAIYM